MTSRADIQNDRLIYSCKCGWLDLGHANPKSRRPYVGATNLWKQLENEKLAMSDKELTSKYEPGFKVVYRQGMGSGLKRVSETGVYVVRPGLSIRQKESVALAIFMDISMKFEAMQANWLWSKLTDSGFSVEDLVSNLLGFYTAVRPGTDYKSLCNPVSKAASEAVWDAHGHPGKTKNFTFKPKFYPCTECKSKGPFPTQLEAIQPDTIVDIPPVSRWKQRPPKLGKGENVRRWSIWDTSGEKGIKATIELQNKWIDHHQD